MMPMSILDWEILSWNHHWQSWISKRRIVIRRMMAVGDGCDYGVEQTRIAANEYEMILLGAPPLLVNDRNHKESSILVCLIRRLSNGS
jgi:hypothetical protein